MEALLSATEGVGAAATSFMHATDPGGAVKARDRLLKAVASRGEVGTMAEGTISLVEAALVKAKARIERRDA